MKTIQVAVVSTNSEGQPDIFFTEVNCTQEEYDNGEHYDCAGSIASGEGYDPVICIDENDAGWQFLKP